MRAPDYLSLFIGWENRQTARLFMNKRAVDLYFKDDYVLAVSGQLR